MRPRRTRVHGSIYYLLPFPIFCAKEEERERETGRQKFERSRSGVVERGGEGTCVRMVISLGIHAVARVERD